MARFGEIPEACGLSGAMCRLTKWTILANVFGNVKIKNMYVVNFDNYSINPYDAEKHKFQKRYDTHAEALNELLFHHQTERKLFEWKEKRLAMLVELADAQRHEESYKKSWFFGVNFAGWPRLPRFFKVSKTMLLKQI